ncbi:hypothetical protein UFOVP181_323 [uncultured Caudovirales phage]|uniref:Uncharacterized protein n=1 Tax=uncultured Caudovirales phage TaxID=2100421 RepID=A0A6J5KXF5_9CAUD|nr:hypothetical protein UFOVP57_316 [uncultured Caudovirales phage]CAB5209118.1 hypothetical protein UFOVP181_323 [uncultured Caudovirales phage]
MAGVGTLITATDYNAIQAKIALVLGTGSGDYGYGQVVSSSSVAVNAKISVTQWNNLQNDIIKARQHQTGTAQTLTTASTSVKITEADRVAYNAMATDTQTYRLTVPPVGQATREDLVATQVRTTNWNGTITQYVTVTFSSYDAARYYFNTGSRFEFSGSRSGGSNTAKDVSWTTILTNMGVIYFDRDNTTTTGTGTGSTIGWADLTTSDQQIFEKDVSGTTYYPNRYLIFARAPATNQIVFTIQFLDASGQPNAPWGTDEDVTGTLTSTVQVYRASGSNVSVPTPSATTTGI